MSNVSSPVEQGVYFVGFGMCTVPYSVVVVSFTQSGLQFMQILTQDKTDAFMNVSKKSNCGLKMKMHALDAEEYNVALRYGCDQQMTELINDTYLTELGMICPLSNCTQVSKMSQNCFVPWIYKKNETRLTDMNVTLEVCKPLVEIKLSIFVHDEQEKILRFMETVKLIAGHEDDWHESGYAKPLRLSLPNFAKTKSEQVISTTNGYLYLDHGNISLYVHEVRQKHLIHILVSSNYRVTSFKFLS